MSFPTVSTWSSTSPPYDLRTTPGPLAPWVNHLFVDRMGFLPNDQQAG